MGGSGDLGDPRVRAEMNVPAAARLPLFVKDADAAAAARLERHREHFLRLARVTEIDAGRDGAGGRHRRGRRRHDADPAGRRRHRSRREQARLAKEIGRLDGDLAKFAQKLGNPAFLAKAKPEVIDEQREREADARRDRDRLKAVYDRIAAE